jgi:hypothetical protein
MTHPFGQDDALAGTLRGLIGIAERPSGHGALPFAADAGIVTTIQQGVVPMHVRVVKGDTLANLILAANEFTAPNQGSPSRVMSLQGQLGISDPIRAIWTKSPRCRRRSSSSWPPPWVVIHNPQVAPKRARLSPSRTASASARR